VDEFAERIMAEISSRRKLSDDRETESYISGLKRAVVLAVGQERAETVFAAHDESY
jgi:hypothetical protein